MQYAPEQNSLIEADLEIQGGCTEGERHKLQLGIQRERKLKMRSLAKMIHVYKTSNHGR